MSNRDRVILWIPTLLCVGTVSTGASCARAFENEGIYYKQHFYPTERTPQGFPRNCDLVLDVPLAAGFSFDKLWFQEKSSSAYTAIYDVNENSLLLPVTLKDIDKYPEDELARYFKEYWMRHE